MFAIIPAHEGFFSWAPSGTLHQASRVFTLHRMVQLSSTWHSSIHLPISSHGLILLISHHSIRQTHTIERHCSAFSTNCVNRIAIRRGETSAREDRKRRGFEGDGRADADGRIPAGQQKSDAAAAASPFRPSVASPPPHIRATSPPRVSSPSSCAPG